MSDIEFCGICRYWEFWRKPKHEDSIGYCHRHASVPIPRVLKEIGHFVGAVAWAVEEGENIEHNEDEDYRFESASSYRIYEWPTTSCCDWCGEFKLREEPLQRNYPNPRYEAAAKWEEENKLGKKEQTKDEEVVPDREGKGLDKTPPAS
jgi:hypothetical protein